MPAGANIPNISGVLLQTVARNVNQRADQKDAYVDINQLDENISSSECLLLNQL